MTEMSHKIIENLRNVTERLLKVTEHFHMTETSHKIIENLLKITKVYKLTEKSNKSATNLPKRDNTWQK